MRALLNQPTLKVVYLNAATNDKDKDGDTPLYLAEKNKHGTVAEMLREHGAVMFSVEYFKNLLNSILQDKLNWQISDDTFKWMLDTLFKKHLRIDDDFVTEDDKKKMLKDLEPFFEENKYVKDAVSNFKFKYLK